MGLVSVVCISTVRSGEWCESLFTQMRWFHLRILGMLCMLLLRWLLHSKWVICSHCLCSVYPALCSGFACSCWSCQCVLYWSIMSMWSKRLQLSTLSCPFFFMAKPYYLEIPDWLSYYISVSPFSTCFTTNYIYGGSYHLKTWHTYIYITHTAQLCNIKVSTGLWWWCYWGGANNLRRGVFHSLSNPRKTLISYHPPLLPPLSALIKRCDGHDSRRSPLFCEQTQISRKSEPCLRLP